MQTELRRTEEGYLEAHPRPSPRELEEYYNEKYFSDESENCTYQNSYTDEELAHKRLDALELHALFPERRSTFLDVGCGEGFFLGTLAEKGWDVHGMDFTHDGVKAFFPNLVDRVQKGDLFSLLQSEAESGRKYDAVSCNNVLEHVLEPSAMLGNLVKLVTPGGLLRLSVPNDDSYYNEDIVGRGLASPEFFKAYPDHLNYFNFDTLEGIVKKSGLEVVHRLGSFPISFFLFNPDSNYRRDRSLGKNCHWARVVIDLLVARQGIEKWIAFRKGCGEAGLGNDVILYCRS